MRFLSEYFLQVALITLCNIFLNVSLQDADAVRQAEVFAEIYGLVANVLPKLGKLPCENKIVQEI